MKGKAPGTGTPRGRGKYNPACDVCARRKTKCDGIKPVCQPCRQQGREQECSWTKNPGPKPRTEQHFEAMHKYAEALQMRAVEWRKYADYLESLLDSSTRDFRPISMADVRIARPPEDGLLRDVFDHDFDPSLPGPDDVDANSDGDPTKELCFPTQSLKLEENGLNHYGTTAPFRFHNTEPHPITTRVSRFPKLAQDPNATYVLLTDGVSDEHYNPDFDWSRYLPDMVPLDRRSHDKALDLTFKFFTSWCLRVVPALFLRDMYRALSIPASHPPPKTPHYSPMLHNALVALGLAFLDDPKLRDLKSRQYFAQKAKSYIETECEKPNLSVVNALSIIASFHSSQGNQTLGYLYFGMSARVAQALGLNVDCSDWVKMGVMDESDILDRRWTYWMTFSQDVCWSLYVGRDFCVPEPSPNMEAFKAISMPLVDLDYDQLPWNHPAARLDPQPNYLTKTFEATCELLMIARRIMHVVNSLDCERSHKRPVIDEQISEIDLNTWKGRLSPELDITVKSRPTSTPHKLMLHLAYWWLFILLHRPFFQRKGRLIYTADREIDHVKLCRRAAENIMELLATWRSLYTLRYCPITLIQTVFSAGTVYLLIAVQAISGSRIAQKELDHSRQQQTLVLQYLHEIGKSWQCATNIAGIMKNLMDEQLKPLLERKTISVSAPCNGSQLLPEVGSNVGEEDQSSIPGSSKERVRHRSLLTKPKPHCLGLHSREHSVNEGPQPSPARPTVSLSPVITISHAHQDSHSPNSYAIPSSNSPARSAPINISSTSTRDSPFSNSPSSFSSSLTDPWAYRSAKSTTFPIRTSGSLSPSFINQYPTANDFPGSAPPSQTTFVHRDAKRQETNPHSYSYVTAFRSTSAPDPVPPLNELAFPGSGHTSSHMFKSTTSVNGLFDMAHDLELTDHFSPTAPLPFMTKDVTGYLGMPGGQTLSQAPSVLGLNFPPLNLSQHNPVSTENTDTFVPPAGQSVTTTLQSFDNDYMTHSAGILITSTSGYEGMPDSDRDMDMDADSQWEMWSQSLLEF